MLNCCQRLSALFWRRPSTPENQQSLLTPEACITEQTEVAISRMPTVQAASKVDAASYLATPTEESFQKNIIIGRILDMMGALSLPQSRAFKKQLSNLDTSMVEPYSIAMDYFFSCSQRYDESYPSLVELKAALEAHSISALASLLASMENIQSTSSFEYLPMPEV